MRQTTAVGLTLLALAARLPADDWPQFRGPGGAGVSVETKLPVEWDGQKNITWRADVPGTGLSSPVVVGDRVFVTTAVPDGKPKDGDPKTADGQRSSLRGRDEFTGRTPNVNMQWCVYCLDRATGKTLWHKTALEGRPRTPIQSGNSYATETPIADGDRVYAFFGNHGLFCYSVAGELLWKKDFGAFATAQGQGTASSPAFDGERVFLQIDNEEKSFVVAVSGRTGDEVWRTPRDERTNYSSPILWKNTARTELVTSGGNKVRSYDPATGKALWELNLGGGRCPASPVGDDERLYVGGGGGGPGGPGRPGGGRGGRGGLFAVRAGASGDITLKDGKSSSEGVAWSQPRGDLEMASPLAYQGYLYVASQTGGLLTCLDAKTGKQLYRERLSNAQNFWASPWAGEGRVFCLDSAGTTHVIKAGPEFDTVGQNRLKDKCWATPAVAGGAVLIRGANTLYSIKP
ncbi:outer membrane protein assembly factor BamB family protein [Limnoglobus roseus]|uniref:outer membrane protein assembly factor BamB family protein n=1 Tax=Limnoglobus roseus TaxID=2598579 RepID=UPI0011EB2CF5|nr:PQQ-binding-like beta-propeller repeat protein [Limnoglobus roseus]